MTEIHIKLFYLTETIIKTFKNPKKTRLDTINCCLKIFVLISDLSRHEQNIPLLLKSISIVLSLKCQCKIMEYTIDLPSWKFCIKILQNYGVMQENVHQFCRLELYFSSKRWKNMINDWKKFKKKLLYHDFICMKPL